MVIRIVKNNTPSPVVLSDLGGLTVPASGQLDLYLGNSLEELAQSDDLAIFIGDGTLTLNVGQDADIPFPRSLDIIRNIPQVCSTTHNDAKLNVVSTPRPTGTFFHATGRADHVHEGGDLSPRFGGGNHFYFRHTIYQHGQDIEDVFAPPGEFISGDHSGGLYSDYWINRMYFDVKTAENETHLYDGLLCWDIDTSEPAMVALTVDIVTIPCNFAPFAVAPGTGNAMLMGGYLAVPHPTGQGDFNLPFGQTEEQTPQDMNIFEFKPSLLQGTYSTPAFFTIEYNLTTHKYFNLLPRENPYDKSPNLDTGNPNIKRMTGNFFAIEIPVHNFVESFVLINNNPYMSIGSGDPISLGANTRIRATAKTIIDEHHRNSAWQIAMLLKMYRMRTI